MVTLSKKLAFIHSFITICKARYLVMCTEDMTTNCCRAVVTVTHLQSVINTSTVNRTDAKPTLVSPAQLSFSSCKKWHSFKTDCNTHTHTHIEDLGGMVLMTLSTSPLRANTSANLNAVSHKIRRRCNTSVDSGDLSQALPKQSAVCSTCIISVPPVNC